MTEIASEQGEHRIEEAAKVYLRLNSDGTGWEVDPLMFDGYPADSPYEHGPIDDSCECGPASGDDATEEHRALMGKARELDLPDIWQLRDLLVAACENNR